MADTETISASEFKAKCLEILDRLAAHRVDRVVVTKRGRPVAILLPPEAGTAALADIHGFMEGTVGIEPGFDLTEPVSDEPFDAEQGGLHG